MHDADADAIAGATSFHKENCINWVVSRNSEQKENENMMK